MKIIFKILQTWRQRGKLTARTDTIWCETFPGKNVAEVIQFIFYIPGQSYELQKYDRVESGAMKLSLDKRLWSSDPGLCLESACASETGVLGQ